MSLPSGGPDVGALSVFFAFQFSDAAVSKTDRENAIVEAVRAVEDEVGQRYPGYTLNWEECVLDSGRQIGEQVVELISKCDIFVADISELNPNVLFELGVAYGLERTGIKRVIWLVHESVDFDDVPSDLKGLYLERYGAQSLRPILARLIRDASLELIERRRIAGGWDEAAINRLWSLTACRSVDLVCSEIPSEEQPYYADPHDRNYLRYGKFADLDSLIYVKARLASLVTDAAIRDFSPSEHYDQNPEAVIVIGGPPWNAKAHEFQVGLPFRFVPHPLGEDDPLELEALPECLFGPTWSNDGRLLKDISLFARIQIEPGFSAFLLMGCLTLGVLGAARCFLDPEYGGSNATYVTSRVGSDDFIAIFETPRTGGFAQVPNIAAHGPLVLLRRASTDGGFKVVHKDCREYMVRDSPSV